MIFWQISLFVEDVHIGKDMKEWKMMSIIVLLQMLFWQAGILTTIQMLQTVPEMDGMKAHGIAHFNTCGGRIISASEQKSERL